MPAEIDILDICARLYQYSIAIGAGIDTLLDSRVVGGDVDNRRPTNGKGIKYANR